jgi:hypothetical protein
MNAIVRRAVALGIVLAAAGAGACSSLGAADLPAVAGQIDAGADASDSRAAQATIGAAGGQLSSADGVLAVEVPPNAVAVNTLFSVQRTAPPAPGLVGAAYDLQPTGTAFSLPVTLSFHYPAVHPPPANPQALIVVTFVGGAWQPVASLVDTTAQTIVASVAHFSIWGLSPMGQDAGPSDGGDAGTDAGCPTECEAGLACCGASCTDTTIDAKNCGGCGVACLDGESCLQSVCVCPIGHRVCGKECINTDTDPENCGACSNACTGGQICNTGMCECPFGESDCAGQCVDTTSDPKNCGGCGVVCPAGQPCLSGKCGCVADSDCAAGQACCAGGCVNTSTDPNNCGGCGNACPDGQGCIAGSCQCAPGVTNAKCCNGIACSGTSQACCTNECVDLDTDPANCGVCGHICLPRESCAAGSCICASDAACNAGETCCLNGCVDTQTDVNNCGACGKACGPNETCVAGSCATPGGPPTGYTGTATRSCTSDGPLFETITATVRWIANATQSEPGKVSFLPEGTVSETETVAGNPICSVMPSSGPIDMRNDGYLTVDRTQAPPTFSATGHTFWQAADCQGSPQRTAGGIWISSGFQLGTAMTGVVAPDETIAGQGTITAPGGSTLTCTYSFNFAPQY